MRVRISSELLRLMVTQATASPGVEVCGLLLGTAGALEDVPDLPFALSLSKGVSRAERSGPVLRQAQRERGGGGAVITDIITEVRPCRNVAADPARAFEIDPAALIAAHRQARAGGPAILGCYHSHPSGSAEPSRRDAVEAEPNGWLWLIVAGSEVRGWRAVTDGAVRQRFDQVGLND